MLSSLISSSDITTSLALLAVVFVVTYLLVNQRPRWNTGGKKLPPSLPAFPIIGSLPYLIGCKDICEYFRNTAKRLGNVFSMYAGSRYVVVLNGRQAIHEALITRGVQFADRNPMYFVAATNPQRLGFIFRPYEASFKHYQQLSLSILKQFGFGMRSMENRIQIEVEALVDELRATNGKPTDPKVVINQSVSNVMMSILFGRRFNATKEPLYANHMLDLHDSIQCIRPECEFFPILRLLPSYRRLNDKIVAISSSQTEYVNKLVQEVAEQQEGRPDCFVSSFIDAEGSNYDQAELVYILREFVAAGIETTSSTLLWSIVLLTNRPFIQERLHAELDSIVGRERAPGLEDRKSLPYLQAVITEIMRYKTLAPTALPHSTSVDTEVSGFFIPANTTVLVNLDSVHMDPETWTDPECFRPERFLDDKGDVIDIEKIIPFSIGKRSCLGEQLARQEIFLFLSRLLHQFQFLLPDGVMHLSEECQTTGSIAISARKCDVRFAYRHSVCVQ